MTHLASTTPTPASRSDEARWRLGEWIGNGAANCRWAVTSWKRAPMFYRVHASEGVVAIDYEWYLGWIGAWCITADDAVAWLNNRGVEAASDAWIYSIVAAPFFSKMEAIDWRPNLPR